MDKASVFHFGLPNFDPNKPRYIDEQEQKKLTYNFVTSKQLKRGHNFGVVYFTPQNLEDELTNSKSKEKNKSLNKAQKEKVKQMKLEEDIIPPVNGRQHVAISTSPVESTLRPKPLTLTKAIQTTDFIDRPRSPLTWHQPTGISIATQIEDGDLFNFDTEVEPILNVLLTKSLDQARMEVLEEEEINLIQKQQRYFEELRNRELMEVQKLEDAETRRIEEISRRYNQQKEKVEITKTYQKKLMARYFSKEYLSKLKTNTMTSLLSKGVFIKQVQRELYYYLVPEIQNKVEKSVKTNLTFIKKLSDVFTYENMSKIQSSHKEAIEKEYKKRKDEETRKKEEKERRKEERRRKIEEEAKIKKDKEKEELKKEIISELLKNTEMVYEVVESYEPDGMSQVNKKYASISGGFMAQWALIMSQLNLNNEDFLNSEKLLKVLEIFMPKFPQVNISLPEAIFEEIKKLDPNVNSVEDLIKCDDKIWVRLNIL